MHLRYFKNLLRHKFFVAVAGSGLGVPMWRLLIHDWTKFTRAEWGPYARRFGSGRAGSLDHSKEANEWRAAWRHHWQHNPHHWEYWVVDGQPRLMPEVYIREMVADWYGAGRAYTGKWSAPEWYQENKHRMNLHPDTKAWVEALLYRAIA